MTEKELIKRRILLKKQLIYLTKVEIKTLENKLKKYLERDAND